jgi:(2R)-sulfolactate sulfo-lyase subunit alpha
MTELFAQPLETIGQKSCGKKSVANLQHRPISQPHADNQTTGQFMKHGILLHELQDDVGVAVTDLKKGSRIGALTLEGKSAGQVQLLDNVPLGHKVAMRALAVDKPVIKYGRPVGKAVKTIARGAHVHTHNVKTLRWSL